MSRCAGTVAFAVFLIVFGSASIVTAQPASTIELQERVRLLEEQVKALQAALDAIRAQSSAPVTQPDAGAAPAVPPTAAPASTEQSAGTLPTYGGASQSSKVFNPDIGIIGNLVGATGESRGGSRNIAPTPLATLQESELSLQAIVDPYARADFFLAIGEEGIEVEKDMSRSLRCPAACWSRLESFARISGGSTHFIITPCRGSTVRW